MNKGQTARLVAVPLALCLALSLSSCRRLKVGGTLEEIEWVIVACHTEGFWKQWVAKLTPESDAKLIGRLVAAIEGAKWKRGTSETGGDGFIVVKIKGHGVRSFNIIPWDYEHEVEIRPTFLSRELYPILEKMGEEKIGWKTDDSLPDLAVREIQVRQDGNLAGVFRPDSPSFARVVAAAEGVLKAFDPRWCMPNYAHGNPTHAWRYQQMPQFALLLGKPIPMYKLTVVDTEKGGHYVAGIRYKAFSSSTIVLYSSREPTAILCDLYISFLPDGAANTSFSWCFDDAFIAPETMGRPDACEAFGELLDVFKKITEKES